MVDIEKRFPNQVPIATLEEEQTKFVNRIEDLVYPLFDGFNTEGTEGIRFKDAAGMFDSICVFLGKSSRQVGVPGRRQLLSDLNPKKDFWTSIKILEHMYSVLYEGAARDFLERNIIHAIKLSRGKVGVSWKSGFFYPAGESLLDEKLIDVALDCLLNYPNTNQDLLNALGDYQKKVSPGNVIGNCYKAVESLAQELPGNTRTLSNNKGELLSKLSLSSQWNTIIARYVDFADEYGKHTRNPERHNIAWREVESTLYLTCLIIRLSLHPVTAFGN